MTNSYKRLIILFVIVILASISNVQAISFPSNEYQTYIYDPLTGSQINQTLWRNVSFAGTTSFSANANYLEVSNNNGAGSGIFSSLSAINFSLNEIEGFNFTYYLDSTRNGGVSNAVTQLIVFGSTGNNLFYNENSVAGSITLFENLTLKRNTLNASIWDFSINSSTNGTIVPTDNYINATANGVNSASNVGTARIYKIYYYDHTNITINSPANNFAPIANGSMIFNASFVPIFGGNLTNATLYIWNSTNGIINSTTNTITGINRNTTTWNVSSPSLGVYNWGVVGCSTNGSNYFCTPSVNQTFISGYTENNRTFNLTTIETSTENFILNITIAPGLSISSSIFYYNNTAYTATVSNEVGNTYLIQRAISIPQVTGTRNNTLFWSLSLSNGIILNTSTSNQTVQDIIFVPCNATYTIVALNFTIREEGTNIPLNASLETAYNFHFDGASGSSLAELNFQNTSENQSNYQFCISPITTRLRVSGPTSYARTGYDRREYWFIDALVNNITQNINLYLLSTASSDVVTLTVLDQNQNPVQGAYVFTQRWDIGTDTFSTVGVVLTGQDGRGLINLRLNDAWYRFTVVYQGTTYLITDPEKLSSTSKTLTINLAASSPYTQFNNISHILVFNNATNTFTFTFNDPSGAVNQGCLRVSRAQGNATLLLDSNCLVTTAGSISYAVTQNGTYLAQGLLRLNSNYSSASQVVDILIKTVGLEERFRVIGTFGQVISFVLIGTAAFFGIAEGSIPLGLGAIVIAAIAVYKIGFLNLGPLVIWSIIAIIILIAITLRRRFQQ